MQQISGNLSSDSPEITGLKTVKVAVAVPLSRIFDYLPSGDLTNYLAGCRVVVPFGRSTRIGVVTGTGESTLPASKLLGCILLSPPGGRGLCHSTAAATSKGIEH